MLRHHLGARLAVEGQPARERVVAGDAERVEIAARVERLAGGLFGAHVMGVPHHAPVGRQGVGLHRAGDTEVADERALGAALEQDVLGRDVAMDEARSMRVRQCPRDLAQHARRLAGQQRATRADALAKGGALHERHGDEDESAALSHGVDRDDVRMCEAGGGLRLAQEGIAQIGARGERGGEDLDGDGAREPHLAGEIDGAHPAAAQFAVERVLAGESGLEGDELGVGLRRHGSRWGPAARSRQRGIPPRTASVHGQVGTFPPCPTRLATHLPRSASPCPRIPAAPRTLDWKA